MKGIGKCYGWAVLFFVICVLMLAGCGGGASGTGSVPVTDIAWTPDPSTVRIGLHFEQTSNLGNKRDAVGTWKPFVDRDQFGDSVAAVFMSYADITDIRATADTAGGSLVFGRSGNKGILLRLNAAGDELWRVEITPPIGNTFIAHGVTTDGNRIAVVYERLPLRDWNVYVYDMAGNGGIIAETNIGYGLESAKALLDGNNLLIARIQPSVPLPAPTPFSTTALIYASMVTGDAPLSAQPLLDPEFVAFGVNGLHVMGQGGHMEYARNLGVSQSQTAWPGAAASMIQDALIVEGSAYAAGSADGKLFLAEAGNAAFRNTAGIPVGTDRVKILSGADGNLFVYIGNRVGRLDKATGEITTLDPPAVPPNAEAYISGGSMYFVTGNALHALPLTQIP